MEAIGSFEGGMNPSLYIIDTHVLLWHLIDSPKLSQRAKEALIQIEKDEAKMLIPAIVLAEVIFIVERGRVQVDLDKLFTYIKEAPNLEVIPLGLEQILLLKEMTQIPGMHDRMIVCDAMLRKAKLLTADVQIQRAGAVEVVW